MIDYNVAFNWDDLTIETVVPPKQWDKTYTVQSPSFSYSNEKSQGVPWVDSDNKYSLKGWTGSGISGQSNTITIPQGSTGDRSYTAVWTYDVTFDVNKGSGSMEKQTITRGELTALTKMTGLTPPTGKYFYGWGINDGGTGKVYMDGEEVLNLGNITLYAIWKDKKTITFNANGGTGTMSSQVVWNGVSTSLNKNSFTAPKNKIFSSWNTESGGGGTTYADGASITVSVDTPLHAIWADKATISFSPNGGTGTMSSQEICSGVSTPLNKNAFVAPEGKIFSSWNTESGGGGTTYADGASITVSVDTQLHAIWTDKATISFSPNGGTGTMTNQGCIKGQSNVLKPNEFTRTGWTFDRWNTAPDGSGLPYIDKGAITPSGNIVLYAIWKCNVNYMSNTETPSEYSDEIHSNNVQYSIKNNIFTHLTDMHLFGWNTKPDGTGTYYSPSTVINVTGELTLYAIWGYQITFKPNGGEGADETQIIPKDIYTELKANDFTPTTNHAFYGWNTDKSSKERTYYDQQKVTIDADIELNAIWGHSITFDLNVCPSGFEAPDTEAVKDGGIAVKPDMGLDAYRVTWYTHKDLAPAHKYEFNTAVDSNLVLYAKWEIQLFLIYNPLSGPDQRDDSIWVPYGEPAHIHFSNDRDLTDEQKPWGWNTNSMGRGAYFKYDQQYTISYPGAFYAIWSDPGTGPYPASERYFITFCSNGGSGYMDKQIVQKADNKITLKSVDESYFYKEGWVFDHWNTRADGNGTSYTDGQAGVLISDNTTLFAFWRHLVSYEANGATGGDVPIDDSVYHEDDTVTVKGNPGALVRTGYTFGGWNTKADGSGDNYVEGNTFTYNGPVVLYAKWESSAVESVTLDHTSVELAVSGTQQLTATIAPVNAPNKNVAWSFSDNAVATVGADGLVTAVAAGTATITVTTEDGHHTANCTVTVTQSE